MKEYDLTIEVWRNYNFGGRDYQINNPLKLYISESGTTHKILSDDGIVHCLPAPGYNGCVLTWLAKDNSKPVAF